LFKALQLAAKYAVAVGSVVLAVLDLVQTLSDDMRSGD
jgi:hypothetical protein